MLKRTSKQLSLFSSLEDMLSHEHPLFQLSNKINWECFENAFSPLNCSANGRPAHPIRLMCGLLILKHLRNVSDEMVVSQWSENAYYQYFCGGLEFMPKQPCDASELVHFRNRIGEKDMELILTPIRFKVPSFIPQVIAHNDSFDLAVGRRFIVSRKYVLEKCELLHLCFSLHLKLHIDRGFCIVESISRHSCQKIDNKV